MRNMMPPTNLVDQIHYDICHGRIKGREIHLTADQMSGAPSVMGRKLHDGMLLLGYTLRVTDGEPDVKYPPDIPNQEWVVGGITFRPRDWLR